ncbi:hypothetical protein GCM10017778_45940 [Streptomyces vinaceus]|nr:hypothetical protein GCM10017778_45940 [Streptomyces vinaceus]
MPPASVSPRASGDKAAAPGVKQSETAAPAKNRTHAEPERAELEGRAKADLYEKGTPRLGYPAAQPRPATNSSGHSPGQTRQKA